MFRRKRRKFSGQWLPTKVEPFNTAGVGNNVNVGDQNLAFTRVLQNYNVSTDGATGPFDIAVTIADQPNLVEAGNAAAVLAVFNAQNAADEQGFGYSLRRIVGSLIVLTAPSINTQAKTPAVVTVGAGFMVRAVQPNNNPDSPAIPNTSPLVYDSGADPWIWRRTWCFSPGNAGGTVNFDATGKDEFLPFNSVLNASNAVYTGANDTASIDQQTRRTVKNEERLFFTLDARAVGHNPEIDDSSFEIAIGFQLDIRLFGRMFSTKGNRRNASR